MHDGYCPNYIHSKGLVSGFHSRPVDCDYNKACYKIYTEIMWSDGKICNYQNMGRHIMNTTDEYSINDVVNVYVLKNNLDRCLIRKQINMESNAICSIVFVILSGIMLIVGISMCIQGNDERRVYIDDIVVSKV